MTKKKEVTIKKEDLELIESVKNRKATLLNEVKELGILEFNLNKRKQAAELYDKQSDAYEKEIAQKLQEKYGVGNLDLERKIFTPAE